MADHHSHYHGSSPSSSSSVKLLLLHQQQQQEEEYSRPQRPRCQTWCVRTRNSSSTSNDDGRGLSYVAADDTKHATTTAATARPRFLSWGIPLSPISIEKQQQQQQQQQQDFRHPKNSSSSSSSSSLSSSRFILSFEDEGLHDKSGHTSSDDNDDDSSSGGSSDDLSILSSNNRSKNKNNRSRNQHRNLPYYALSRYWKSTTNTNTKKNTVTYESGDEEDEFADEEYCYNAAADAAMEDIEAQTTTNVLPNSSSTTAISEQEPEEFPFAPLEKRHLRVPSVTSIHFKQYSQGKNNPLHVHVPPIVRDPYLCSPDQITSDILMGGESSMTLDSHRHQQQQQQQQQPATAPCYHYTPSILSYKSILFPKISKARDRNCNTYMFSIVVGAIVMFVFAIYVILAIV